MTSTNDGLRANGRSGDEVRVLDIVLVGCIYEGIDTVVHVLLDRVVYGAFAAGRAGAVVIYAKSATAIYEIYIVAHLVEADIELGCFTESSLNAADLGNLTSDVEVDKAQTVVESHLVYLLEGCEEFGACQAELRCIATASAHLPEPEEASLMRIPMFGFTLSFLATFSMISSSLSFSTTIKMRLPIF